MRSALPEGRWSAEASLLPEARRQARHRRRVAAAEAGQALHALITERLGVQDQAQRPGSGAEQLMSAHNLDISELERMLANLQWGNVNLATLLALGLEVRLPPLPGAAGSTSEQAGMKEETRQGRT